MYKKVLYYTILGMLEKYLNNLSTLIMKEMSKRNCTSKELSIICDISEREMSAIKNRERNDVRLSVIVKICENTSISYNDIFEIEDNEIFEQGLKKCFLSNGKEKFYLRKVH